jgi:hypothetical protein
MEHIHYDMSQFYPLKAMFEQLFGKRCYQRLKETAGLADWKTETLRLLRAIEVALNTTVQVTDDAWREEIEQVLKLGRSHIAGAKSAAELFANLSATLGRLVFLQIGYLPTRSSFETVSLAPRNWKLDAIRTVQYVQSKPQAAVALRQQARRRTRRSTNDA